MEREKLPGEYARKVYDGTRRFTQDLLAENERLRTLCASLESDRSLAAEEARRVREELERFRSQQGQLEQTLATIEKENRDYSTRYVEIEAHNFNLMNLYVATLRLHGTLSRDEILEIIKDIIVNLVGSEEIGVFEFDDAGRTLQLVTSVGIDAVRWASVPSSAGIVGHVARTGKTFLAGQPAPAPLAAGEESLTAAIPLNRVNQVVGAIAVFRLLPHKPALEAFDQELLTLLSTQVAMALYATAGGPGFARAGA